MYLIHRPSSVMLLAVFILGGLSSCTSERLAWDHRVMREELLELYDEQLLDNLIRAHNGLPVLQIRYGVIDGFAKTNAEVSGAYVDDDTDFINVTSTGERGTGSITDTDNSNISGGVSIESTMRVTGTPVLDDPGLHDAYRDFADRYLKVGNSPPAISDQQILLYGSRVENAGMQKVVRYYWVLAEVPSTGGDSTDESSPPVDVKKKLAELADRVMLEKEEPPSADLPESANVLVSGLEREIASDSSQTGDVLSFEEAIIAPPLRLSHGSIEIRAKSRLDPTAYAAVRVVVVATSEEKRTSTVELYVHRGEIMRAVRNDPDANGPVIAGLEDMGWENEAKTLDDEVKKLKDAKRFEEAKKLKKEGQELLEKKMNDIPDHIIAEAWIRGRLLGSSHKLAYAQRAVPGVDLNSLMTRLVE